MREAIVDGQRFALPRGITRVGQGWRVFVARVGLRAVQKQFPDRAHASPAAALRTAEHFLADVRSSLRPAYQCLALPRRAVRAVTLERRMRTGVGGNPLPRYALVIRPSKSAWFRGWMRIHVGTLARITQEKIDDALATLHARWSLYRTLSTTSSAAAVVDAPEILSAPMPPGTLPYALALADVLAWNGHGTHVRYSPRGAADNAQWRLRPPPAPEEMR